MPTAPPALARSPLAEIWPQLPSLAGTVDPFSFRQRLALYRLLMDSSNQQGVFGTDNAGNPFWGYSFQLHWQWRSGRYHVEDGQPGDLIHPNSLWGFNNYALSVIPYVGAVQAGLAPELSLVAAPAGCPAPYASGGGPTPFHIPPVFAEAVAEWRRFFALIGTLRAGDDTEPVRFALWKAHATSLEAAEHDSPALASGVSVKEQTFLRGWVRMVDFLGTAAWRTDLDFMLVNGLDVLPERVLTDHDVPGHIPDMDAQVNANVGSIFELQGQSKARFAFNLWLWKRAMRTRPARNDVLEMLAAQFAPTPENREARRRLMRYMISVRPRD